MSRRTSALHYPPAMMSPVDTAYTLLCLSEYAHTLDSLPIDLSRSYGDLRELDAVLSSSMTLLTAKINELIHMIETKTGTNDDRLFLLTEIAEEAGRLKLGGEDKIRVACHAADGLRAHRNNMNALLEQASDKDFSAAAEALARKTVYPHVATHKFYPPGMTGEGGRRARRAPGASNGYGQLLSNGVDPSPAKRRKVAKDDDVDVTRTPTKKERGDAAPAQRPRNGGRAKNLPSRVADRAASPTESIASVASHLPQALPPHPLLFPPSSRAANNSVSNKRPHHVEPSVSRVAYPAQPPPSSHPSLPAPYPPPRGTPMVDAHAVRAMSNVPDWPHGQLEGPGMPVARAFQQLIGTNDVDPGAVSGAGEGEGEVDDNKTYCFCNGVSYGEMIACDDKECEREWFHLPCVDLQFPPEGTKWFCSTCLERRANRGRTNRGGKKRAAGGRAGAKNT
ncbi:uncharacterized protein BXZ73DRAFT_46906 [Epithele typhae]|uniref:uncharacterized protein n=1 Tax=Epithele typhae TaxID=378194 RepID=UPI002008BFA6|nr:uncharacterized protein BXZ73DRAFT_46906 [Epithele typhae]KAH9932062.1 hypothetical protein BXZ73DRAFT_46906 [Epithele typhae]